VKFKGEWREQMDFNTLVDQIAKKVLDKMESHKSRLMVLAQTNHNRCSYLLESSAVAEHYEMDFVLPDDKEINVSSYQTVVLYDLTCDNLAKIVTGAADTEYTAIAVQAILAGKKVFVPKEEIELFRYKSTAPNVYYKMMLDKLNFLAEAGVIFCGLDKLENELIVRRADAENHMLDDKNTPAKPDSGQIMLSKRVVTESDIRAALADGIVCVAVKQETIITDLARDYARDCKICIKKI